MFVTETRYRTSIELSEELRVLCVYAMEVHSHLGPGLLESIYEACLCHEFDRAGLAYTRQQPLPVKYKGHDIECQFRLDLLAEQSLLLESRLRLGSLLNFNELRLKDGIGRRRV